MVEVNKAVSVRALWNTIPPDLRKRASHMRPYDFTRWVWALESGRYIQAYHELCRIEPDSAEHARRERNCCLGVLCRVLRVPRVQWSLKALLPEVMVRASSRKFHSMCVAMNDNRRMTFDEIAVWLRRNRKFIVDDS